MQAIQRAIQQELGPGNSGQDEASVDPYAGPDASSDVSHIEMAALPLPPPGTKQWSPDGKAAVVAAVRGRILTLDEACEQYALSVQEYLTWQHGIDLFGSAGLRVTEPQRRNAKTRSTH
jgi:hypothetical protein